jgi:hypothetical protein
MPMLRREWSGALVQRPVRPRTGLIAAVKQPERGKKERDMSAAIELMEQLPTQRSLREVPNNTPDFVFYDLPQETRLRQALDKVAELEQETEQLRSQLWQRERELNRRNALLRNARVREQTLRAQLAAHMH